MKVKKISSFVWLFVLLKSSVCSAATFNSFFDIIYSKNDSAIVEVLNDSESFSHIFSVSVFEIDNPVDRNPVASSNSNIIAFTPSKQIVKPKQRARVKFLYNGPKDDKERYFAIKWNDATLKKSDLKSSREDDKAGSLYVNTSIITTLIVNPRIGKNIVKYKDGHVLNEGNTTVDLYVNGICKESSESCSLTTPILPGQQVSVKPFNIDKGFNVGYWVSDKVTQQVDVSG
ncbi:MAG: hypothetical protein ACRCVV_09070 [Shewanella sp.]